MNRLAHVAKISSLIVALATPASSLTGCVDVRPSFPIHAVNEEGGRPDILDVPTPDDTPTATPTPTASETPSATPTPSPSPSPTPTSTQTDSPTATPTPTATFPEDRDGDGFRVEDGDCDDTNPAIFPGAQDLPYDGLDSNCNGYQDWGETILGVRLDGYGDPLGVRIGQLEDVAVGPEGEVYFSDSKLCLIRKVQDGEVTIIAGTGVCGSSGEVGPGVGMEVEPETLALDPVRRRLYFSELFNDRIRYVDIDTGMVHPYIGTGEPGDPFDGALAEGTTICSPSSLAVDAQTGTLFFELIRDSFNGCLSGTWRAVDTGSQVLILKVGGNGSCGGPFSTSALDSPFCPAGLESTPGGNPVYGTIYAFSDQDGLYQVDNVVSDEPTLTLVAGDLERSCDPPSTSVPLGTSLCQPENPALASDGTLYIPQRGGTVLRYIPEPAKLEWIAGQGIPRGELAPVAERGDSEAKQAGLGALAGLDWDDTTESLFLADQGTGLIRWLRLNHASPGVHWVFDYAGLQENGYQVGAVETAQLDRPYGLDTWVDPETGDEVVYVTDIGSDALIEVRNGLVTRLAGQPGVGASEGDGGPAIDATLYEPLSVSVSDDGDIYILEAFRIRRIRDGAIEAVAGGESRDFSPDGTPATEALLNSAGDIIISPDGSKLYISESTGGRLRLIPIVDGDPQPIVTLAGGGELPLTQGVNALEVDLPGNISMWLDNEDLYLVQKFDGSIIRVNPTGTIDIIASIEGQYDAGEGDVLLLPDAPLSMAIDEWGTLFVLCQNNTLYQARNGTLIRTMGNAEQSRYLKDQGPAIDVSINGTDSLEFNAAGDLLIPSSTNHHIRALRF